MLTFRENTRRWLDGIILALLLVSGTLLGHNALHNEGRSRNFFSLYHSELGPAVMLACGHGYQTPDKKASPELARFLAPDHPQRADPFDCHDLPADISLSPPNGMQKMYRYLYGLAGAWWKLTGHVSWSGLHVVFGFFHGVTVVVAYLMGRLLFGRGVSLLFAGGVMLAPGIYWAVMNVREYTKITFILLIVLLLGMTLNTPGGSRRLYGWSAAVGVAMGFGIGFRLDLLVYLPLMVVTLLWLGQGAWRDYWRHRFLALLVMLIAMGGVGAPIWLTLFSEGNPSSTMYMGFQNGFSSYMGVRHGLYEVSYQQHDTFQLYQIQEHAQRLYAERVTGPAVDRIGDFYTIEYARAGQRLLQETLQLFPADVVVRGLASVKSMANLLWPGHVGFYLAMTALLLVVAHHWRVGIFLALTLLIMGGTPAILFKPRHYSHNIIISLWVAALFLQITLQVLWQRFPIRWGEGIVAAFMREFLPAPHPYGVSMKRAVINAGLFLMLVVIPLTALVYGLREHQAPRVLAYLERVAALGRESLTMKVVPLSEGRVRLQPEGFPRENKSSNIAVADYLLLTFDRSACGADEVPVVFSYDRFARGAHVFDRETTVVLPRDGALSIYFPVYSNAVTQFAGLDLPLRLRPCLTGMYRVLNFETLPLLLTLTLPQDWRSHPMFQRLTMESTPIEHSPFLIRNRSHGFPENDMGL